MAFHTYKVCQNRGKARIWLEGSRLAEIGIKPGMPYVKRFLPELDCLYLDFGKLDHGKPIKVSGTDSRPVIDICSREITDWLDGATHYAVEFAIMSDGSRMIVIDPKRNPADHAARMDAGLKTLNSL